MYAGNASTRVYRLVGVRGNAEWGVRRTSLQVVTDRVGAVRGIAAFHGARLCTRSPSEMTVMRVRGSAVAVCLFLTRNLSLSRARSLSPPPHPLCVCVCVCVCVYCVCLCVHLSLLRARHGALHTQTPLIKPKRSHSNSSFQFGQWGSDDGEDEVIWRASMSASACLLVT